MIAHAQPCLGCGTVAHCGCTEAPEVDCETCGDTLELAGLPCPECFGDDGGEPCEECEARFATHTVHGRRLCDGCGHIEARVSPFAMECPW